MIEMILFVVSGLCNVWYQNIVPGSTATGDLQMRTLGPYPRNQCLHTHCNKIPTHGEDGETLFCGTLVQWAQHLWPWHWAFKTAGSSRFWVDFQRKDGSALWGLLTEQATLHTCLPDASYLWPNYLYHCLLAGPAEYQHHHCSCYLLCCPKASLRVCWLIWLKKSNYWERKHKLVCFCLAYLWRESMAALSNAW